MENIENNTGTENVTEITPETETPEATEATEVPEATETPKTPQTEGSLILFGREVYEWVENFITAIVVMVLLMSFVFKTTMVDGNSMLPTLENQERLLITNLFYKPKYNDIVVVLAEKLPDEKREKMGKPIVKRVIGLPGDKIKIDFELGIVYRNNVALETTLAPNGYYVEDNHMIRSLTQRALDMPDDGIAVPDRTVFVMGDNRNDSLDSRSKRIGFVNESDIIGHALWRFYPLGKFGNPEKLPDIAANLPGNSDNSENSDNSDNSENSDTEYGE
ncbi:hypothetical protein FACS189499_08890 [Clostridia bacterium]|nr:hypothetical protein FACS189499_08890 [Clostridia bacterium]